MDFCLFCSRCAPLSQNSTSLKVGFTVGVRKGQTTPSALRTSSAEVLVQLWESIHIKTKNSD